MRGGSYIQRVTKLNYFKFRPLKTKLKIMSRRAIKAIAQFGRLPRRAVVHDELDSTARSDIWNKYFMSITDYPLSRASWTRPRRAATVL